MRGHFDKEAALQSIDVGEPLADQQEMNDNDYSDRSSNALLPLSQKHAF